MSRVLRRPMFRGGIADSEGTGITSGLTDNYGQGGRVGFKKGKGVFDFFSPEVVTEEEMKNRSDIYPYQQRDVSELLDFIPATRTFGIGSGILKTFGKSPQIIDKFGRYQTAKPDFISGPKGTSPYQSPAFGTNAAIREALGPYLSGAKELTKTGLKKVKDYALSLGLTGGGGYLAYDALKGDEKKQDQNNIKDPNQKEIDPNLQAIMDENKKLQELLYNKRQTEQPRESDTDIMNRYMEMFKANLAGDKDELKSQRYFELAKFGLNLLSQPGGPPGGKRDLLGAVGRAGVPAIEGLSRISAEEKAAERQAKILGFQAALRELENPALKKIQTLSKLTGIPESEIAKREIAESAQTSNVRENIIQQYTSLLDAKNPIDNRKIAEEIVGMNKNLTEFQKHTSPKEKPVNPKIGQYYYFSTPGDQGEVVGRWNGKAFLVPGDKGFK